MVAYGKCKCGLTPDERRLKLLSDEYEDNVMEMEVDWTRNPLKRRQPLTDDTNMDTRRQHDERLSNKYDKNRGWRGGKKPDK